MIKGGQYPGEYWISFMGLVDCAESQAHQFAVLQVNTEEAQMKEDINENSHISNRIPYTKPKFSAEKPAGIVSC